MNRRHNLDRIPKGRGMLAVVQRPYGSLKRRELKEPPSNYTRKIKQWDDSKGLPREKRFRLKYTVPLISKLPNTRYRQMMTPFELSKGSSSPHGFGMPMFKNLGRLTK